MARYRHDTKYGPVDIETRSIDDGWVAAVSGSPLPVDLAPDDGPVPLLEDEAVDAAGHELAEESPAPLAG